MADEMSILSGTRCIKMKRISIMSMKKKYKNKNFFLTTFFDNHLHCAAIFDRDVTQALINRISKTHSVWKRDDTWYIF